MQHLHFFDPKRAVKHPPLVFLLHSAEGSARMFQGMDIPLLLEKGFAAVALEAPFSRSRNAVQPRGLVSPRNERCLWDQTVEELAIALDEAVDRWHCDPGRIAFLGLNLGAGMGAYWIAKGAPVRAAVLAGGVPDLTDFWLHSEHPAAALARQHEGVDAEGYESRMRETDLIQTVPHFRRTKTLVQLGTLDPWISVDSRTKAQQAFGALPHVRVATVEDDHEMRSPAAVRARVSFLEDALGFDSHW